MAKYRAKCCNERLHFVLKQEDQQSSKHTSIQVIYEFRTLSIHRVSRYSDLNLTRERRNMILPSKRIRPYFTNNYQKKSFDVV